MLKTVLFNDQSLLCYQKILPEILSEYKEKEPE